MLFSHLTGQDDGARFYAWETFHIIWLVAMLVGIVAVCVFARKTSDRANKIILWSMGGVLLLFEIFKQIITTATSIGEGVYAGQYHFPAIPWHLCSIPMYLFIIAPFVRNKTVRNAMYGFVATFGLISGLIVMAEPTDVLATGYWVIAIQTMLHHAVQVIAGVYIIVSGRAPFKRSTFLGAFVIFAITVAVATLLNTIAMWAGIHELAAHTFNMFYISPWVRTGLPVMGYIQDISWFLFLAVYMLVLSIGAFVVYSLVYLPTRLGRRSK